MRTLPLYNMDTNVPVNASELIVIVIGCMDECTPEVSAAETDRQRCFRTVYDTQAFVTVTGIISNVYHLAIKNK